MIFFFVCFFVLFVLLLNSFLRLYVHLSAQLKRGYFSDVKKNKKKTFFFKRKGQTQVRFLHWVTHERRTVTAAFH